MPVDYNEVLREMDTQIAFHEGEIETLRIARPAIVKMRNASASGGFKIPVTAATVNGRFAGLGNQAAVRLLMADGQLRTRDEIYRELKDGGFTSDAKDPAGSVGATLSQMKDELERVEDRWRKKTSVEHVVFNATPAWSPTSGSLTPPPIPPVPPAPPFGALPQIATGQPSPFER